MLKFHIRLFLCQGFQAVNRRGCVLGCDKEFSAFIVNAYGLSLYEITLVGMGEGNDPGFLYKHVFPSLMNIPSVVIGIPVCQDDQRLSVARQIHCRGLRYMAPVPAFQAPSWPSPETTGSSPDGGGMLVSPAIGLAIKMDSESPPPNGSS